MLISKDEVLKIAQVSQIAVHEKEIEPLRHILEQVLGYARRVAEIKGEALSKLLKNHNVFREDAAIECNAEPILLRAPERTDNYFVVPTILDIPEKL